MVVFGGRKMRSTASDTPRIHESTTIDLVLLMFVLRSPRIQALVNLDIHWSHITLTTESVLVFVGAVYCSVSPRWIRARTQLSGRLGGFF